jgi:hypothetical protein
MFREWTSQPLPVHSEVALEVGREIILKIARAIGHNTPAFPSAKDSRRMMMRQFWKKYGLNEVYGGECGPQVQRCMKDILEDLGHMNEVDLKEQITIRTTKTTHQAPPPITRLKIVRSYNIQHTIEGLLEFVSTDMRDNQRHT